MTDMRKLTPQSCLSSSLPSELFLCVIKKTTNKKLQRGGQEQTASLRAIHSWGAHSQCNTDEKEYINKSNPQKARTALVKH